MALRSRLHIVLGVIGCGLAIAFRDAYSSLAILLVVIMAATVDGFVSLVQLFRLRKRPPAFTVAGGRFFARLLAPWGYFASPQLTMLGMATGATLDGFPEIAREAPVEAWTLLGVNAVAALGIIALAVTASKMASSRIELTPEGVVSRMLWDRRVIPWEALSPGGPPRPARNANHIRLVLTRPELVRRGRFRLWHKDDWIPTATDVHPWLLADAIRWYAEHPEDRAAIGTEAEHARLLAALGTAPIPTHGRAS